MEFTSTTIWDIVVVFKNVIYTVQFKVENGFSLHTLPTILCPKNTACVSLRKDMSMNSNGRAGSGDRFKQFGLFFFRS